MSSCAAGATTPTWTAWSTTASNCVGDIPTPTLASFKELAKTPFFHSYGWAPKIVAEIRDTGVHVYSMDTNLFGDHGFSTSVSTGPGVWDFSALTNLMDMIVQQDPQAKFVLRPYAGSPDWWKGNVPHCVEKQEDGTIAAHNQNVSPVCPELRAQWVVGISELKKALEHKGYYNRVVALTITGRSSQEWLNFDNNFDIYKSVKPLAYSPADIADFARWANERGWSTHVPTQAQFAAASSVDSPNHPTRSTFLDTAVDNDVIHYNLYRSQATAETILFLAKNIRDAFPGRAIGVIYGYMNGGGSPTTGHNALSKVLASPYIDFINPMPDYTDRHVGGADMERQPITSVRVHGKMIFNDYDQPTSVTRENYEYLCSVYGASSDPNLQQLYRENCKGSWPYDSMIKATEHGLYGDVLNLRRWLGYTIARNMRYSYLSLHNNGELGKSFLSNPGLLDVVSQVNAAKRNAARYDNSSTAQVLVVSDEDSNAYMRFGLNDINSHSLLTPLIALNKMGAPYDHVLLRDIAYMNTDQYKLIIFLNAWSVDQTMRTIIAQKLKKDGKVLLFNYAAGLYDGPNKSDSLMADLTGINVFNQQSFKNPVIKIGTNADSWFKQAYDIRPRFNQDTCCDYLASDGSGVKIGFNDEGVATAVYAPQNGWISVWFATLDVPPGVFRDIARGAGVHIYSDTNDPFYANKSFVTLVAGAAGHKTITFPRPVTVREMISDTVLEINTTTYDFDAVFGDVHLLRVE